MSRIHIYGGNALWLIFIFLCAVILPRASFADDSEALPAEHAEHQQSPAEIQNEITEIERHISIKMGRWKAGITSISLLPPSERSIRYGGGVMADSAPGMTSIVPPAGYVDKTYAAPMSATGAGSALPAAFDWRNYNGRNYVTGVRHQGACQSCWAFAVIAALESKSLITMNTPDIDLNLSEQIVLACGKSGNCLNGGWPDKASDFLVKSGSAGEAFGLYSAASGTMPRCEPAAGWKDPSNAYRISDWRYVNRNSKPSVETLKNAVYDSGPLVTTMRIFSDFYFYKSGVYSPAVSSYNGDHAVVIVGWDDAEQAFIAKNSWGKNWGEKGYFRIAYSEVAGKSRFANLMTLAYGKAITPKCIVGLTSNAQTAPATDLAEVSVDVAGSSPSCPWAGSSNVDWIKIISGNGSGNGKITYSVEANPGKERTGTIMVADQALTIRQLGSTNALQPIRPLLPTVDPQGARAPLCTLRASPRTIHAGQSATLTASCVPAADSYQWARSGNDMRDTGMPEFGKTTASGRVSPTETTTYSVVGSNAGGQGKAASVTVTVTTPAPLAPTLLTAPKGEIQTAQPTFNWNASAGATAYRLSIWQGSRVILDQTFTSSSLGCRAEADMCSVTPSLPLQNGVRYGWWVKAMNAGSSPWSRPVYFEVARVKPNPAPAPVTPAPVTPAPSVPSVPPLPAPSLIGPDGVDFTARPTFSWHASAGATSYRLAINSFQNTLVSLTFSAAEAGCASGTGKCSVTPAVALKDFVYTWSVTALNGQQASRASRSMSLWAPFAAVH